MKKTVLIIVAIVFSILAGQVTNLPTQYFLLIALVHIEMFQCGSYAILLIG